MITLLQTFHIIRAEGKSEALLAAIREMLLPVGSQYCKLFLSSLRMP